MSENNFEYLLPCPLDPIEFIERHASQTPHHIAMRHPRGNFTYKELLAGIDQIAAEFHRAGLRQGETAAVQMGDYFVALMSALALSRLGCICIFQVIERQMSEIAVKALITKGGSDLQGIPHIEFQDSWLAKSQTPAPAYDFQKGFLSNDSLAIYTSSSGSTGWPKIIPSTWARLHKAVVDSLLHKHHDPSLSPCLVSLGFTSLWGYRQMLTILWTGGTLVFGNVHISTASHFRVLGIRHLVASIAQLALWAKIAGDRPEYFRTVEAVTTGGARLSPKLAEGVRRNICREIYINYGSTETGLIAAGNAEILDRHPDAVGVVLDTATVEIVDADGNVLPRGETGTVRVRTGTMSGVAGMGEAERGWFFTGDSGALSEEGILSIFGRNDGVTNIDGVKVRLEDAEQLLGECPGVADVALFTIQNELGLSALYCAYVPEQGFDYALFVEHQLQLPKIQKSIELKAIPRGGNGKVLRHELVSLFANTKK